MNAREFYNKRIKEESTIGSVELMDEFAKYQQSKLVEWLEKERDKAEYQMYEHTFQEVLNKIKELNK